MNAENADGKEDARIRIKQGGQSAGIMKRYKGMTKNMRRRSRREKWNRKLSWLDSLVICCLFLVSEIIVLAIAMLWTMWPYMEVVLWGP